MPRIQKIHWSDLSREKGYGFFAIWPEPIDHDRCFENAGFFAFADSDDDWHRDFAELINGLFVALQTFGLPQLIAGELPTRRRFRFLPPREAGTIVEALEYAATDDQFPPCKIVFGAPNGPSISASDGHPIFWLSTCKGLCFEDILKEISRGRPTKQTELDWSHL